MQLNVPDSLAETFIHAVGESNVLRFLLNKNLPTDLFDRFCFLDQGVTVDAVCAALGLELCESLARQGLLRLGEIVPHTRASLAEKFYLCAADISAIETLLTQANLRLGDSIAEWQHYRRTVPRSFRLFRSNARTLADLYRSGQAAATILPSDAESALV